MPRSRTTAVNASPAAAAETVVATLQGLSVPWNDPVDLEATLDLTVGTAGTAVTLVLRRGATTAGAAVQTYGPFTVAAGNRVNLTINGVDVQALESGAAAYCLTATVLNATGASVVNAVYIGALW